MIKAKFGFFQVQIKRMLRHTVELCQPSFRITPKRLDAVDMPLAVGKLVLTMVHSKVLGKADVHQAVVTTPAIRMNHTTHIDAPAHNALQRGFGAIWYDFCIHFSLAFQQAKHDRFAICPTSALTAHTLCTKVRVIDFNASCQRRTLLAGFCQAVAYFKVNAIHRTYRYADQFCATCCRKIQPKATHKLPKLGFCDSRTAVISVFINHLKRLSYVNVCLTS